MSDSPPFDVSVQNGVTIIRLSAELASIYETELPQLAPILEIVDSVEPARVVLDLNQARYVGSAFIGFLIANASHMAARPNGRLGLCGLSSFCRMALESTKSDLLIEMFNGAEEAVSALRLGD